MRQLVFTIVLFLLIPNDILGQSRRSEYKILNDTIVALMKKKDKSKTIILYEDSNFIIKTSLINFKENNSANWLLNHYSCVKELFKQTEKDKIVNISKLSRDDFRLRRDCMHVTAKLLEKGHCLVQYKKTKKLVSEVKIQEYLYLCGSDCGHGGKQFYFDGIFLFETMEWAAI